MCGIAGFVDKESNFTEFCLSKMVRTLNHRGPDSSSKLLIEHEKQNIGLGHTRLAIQDLSSSGSQPMKFDDKYIVFNGEVYNFKEIKFELISMGYEFESSTDTEVILKGFDAWGIDIVKKLNGMFAIALIDLENNNLFLIRDRTGVKPLYFGFINNALLFSSELKALLALNLNLNIDYISISNFMKFGYVSGDKSIYKEFKQVKPGHYIEYNFKNSFFAEKEYWKLSDSYTKDKEILTESEDILVDEVEKLLVSSFKYRMISDVPVGVFLSGGYDSTLVASILQKHSKKPIKTFTIGFDDKNHDESIYAKSISEFIGTEHYEKICTEKDAVEIANKLVDIYDEPFADCSAIPTILVSEFASKHVKVVLSADGGDEQFYGYNKYKYLDNVMKIKKIIPVFVCKSSILFVRSSLFKFLASIFGFKNSNQRLDKIGAILSEPSPVKSLFNISSYFTNKEIDELLKCNVINKDVDEDYLSEIECDNKKVMCADYSSYLPGDILTKVDRATMSASIEGREPLLDYRITELSARIPTKFHFKNGVKKNILKKICHKHIPKKYVDRPKKGFSVPLDSWLRGDLKYLVDKHLNKGSVEKFSILNYEEVEKYLNKFYSGKDVSAMKIWNMLILQMWLDKWHKL